MKTIYVVLRGENREFRRLFSSRGGAEGYISTGQKAGIDGSESEFVEVHQVREEASCDSCISNEE
ncbi:hypothetical protein LCGC14_0221120 [marine sediment metagenome]|uniref:Uncharacterized protein n=1 Tax=marine sediment metagenome TaxID=412755 RepID=A0A0F9UHU6_9ZZZZ